MRDLSMHEDPETGPKYEPIGNQDVGSGGGPPGGRQDKSSRVLDGRPAEPRSFADN